ncbi:MAG TPA: hypothetical protein VKN99_28390 [Polyangia bacterium]|nr:hypothetical protein [Polyangia bacterium]
MSDRAVSDQYLWDGSGAPDPEVERLERVLGRLRWREQPMPLPRLAARAVPVRRWLGVAALAGGLALGMVAWLEGRPTPPRADATATASVDARVTRMSSDAGLCDGSK